MKKNKNFGKVKVTFSVRNYRGQSRHVAEDVTKGEMWAWEHLCLEKFELSSMDHGKPEKNYTQ